MVPFSHLNLQMFIEILRNTSLCTGERVSPQHKRCAVMAVGYPSVQKKKKKKKKMAMPVSRQCLCSYYNVNKTTIWMGKTFLLKFVKFDRGYNLNRGF